MDIFYKLWTSTGKSTQRSQDRAPTLTLAGYSRDLGSPGDWRLALPAADNAVWDRRSKHSKFKHFHHSGGAAGEGKPHTPGLHAYPVPLSQLTSDWKQTTVSFLPSLSYFTFKG